MSSKTIFFVTTSNTLEYCLKFIFIFITVRTGDMYYVYLMLETFPSYNFSNMQFPKLQFLKYAISQAPSQNMEINACLVLKIDIKMTLKMPSIEHSRRIGFRTSERGTLSPPVVAGILYCPSIQSSCSGRNPTLSFHPVLL